MKAVVLTPAQVGPLMFASFRRGNLGPYRGYSYSFRCEKHPRLAFTEYTYQGDLRREKSMRRERRWEVDGKEYPNMLAALAALAVDPVLTENEARVLAMLSALPEDFREFEKRAYAEFGIAPRQDGDVIHNVNDADRAIEGLEEKDFVFFGKRIGSDPSNDVVTIEKRGVSFK